MKITNLNAPDHRYSYSNGLTDGRRAWLAGQTASRYDPTTKHLVTAGTAGEQVNTALDKIENVLRGGSLATAAITHIRDYVPASAFEAYQQMLQARVGRLSADACASLVIIEGLLRDAAVIEVEVDVAPTARLTFCPTITPIDSDGTVQFAGDLRSQQSLCADRFAAYLEADGGTPQVAIAVTQSLVGGADGLTVAELAARIGVDDTVLARRLISAPFGDGMCVSLAATVAPAESTRPVDLRFNSPLEGAAIGVDDTVMLTRLRCASEATLIAQADAVFAGFADLVAQLGPSYQAVRTVEWVDRSVLSEYRRVADVRRQHLEPPFPAATGLVCAPDPSGDVMFELDVVLVEMR